MAPSPPGVRNRPRATIRRMVVLGAGGDLAARLILPGLAGLFALGKLPDGFRLVGLDRPEWDGDAFRDHVREAITAHGDDTTVAVADEFASLCSYIHGDAGDAAAVKAALETSEGPAVVY